MDAPPDDLPNFQIKFPRFKSLNEDDKIDIKKNSKAESTHRATQVWMNCLKEYLKEKGKPEIEQIATDQLPAILSFTQKPVKNETEMSQLSTKIQP